jgi:hypothetical protein
MTLPGLQSIKNRFELRQRRRVVLCQYSSIANSVETLHAYSPQRSHFMRGASRWCLQTSREMCQDI